jgi:hypothetical protein
VVVRRYFAALVILEFLLCLVPEAPCHAQGTVLSPEAGARIGAAFDSLAPPWVMDRAAVATHQVEARVCRDAGGAECYELLLSPPLQHCPGLALPAWCVTSATPMPESLKKALASAFGAGGAGEVWSVPVRTAPLPIHEEATWLPLFLAWLLALGTLVLPVLAGAFAGAGLARLRGRLRSWWSGGLVFVLSLLPTLVLPMEWLLVGFYDLALMGGLFAVSLILTGHRWGARVGRREVALIGVGVLLGGLCAETGARLLLPNPPAFPPPAAANLLLPAGGGFPHHGETCEALFPTLYPETLARRYRYPSRPIQVLHAGDSMLAGIDAPPEERTVPRLNGADPEVSHIDGGFPGTAPDHYYLITRRWLQQVPVDLVVWHVYVYNDVENPLAHPYSCCDNLPPLDFTRGQLVERCLVPSEAGFFGNRVVNSPAPYVLRLATQFSYLARGLSEAIGRGPRAAVVDGVSVAERLLRVRTVIARAKEELDEMGIPMVMVMVPFRGEWEPYTHVLDVQRSNRAFLQALCAELDIPCLDGREAFNGVVDREGVRPFFVNEPVWDIHFSSRGQQVYADWLHRVLPIPEVR